MALAVPVTTGGGGATTTDLETMGPGAPSTTSSLQALPTATEVGVNSPHVSLPTALALLTLPSTTLTAYAVPSTTGLAVLADSGSTLTFRGEGVTLPGGEVVSLGFDGLVVSTTTATYLPLTGSDGVAVLTRSASGLPTAPGPVIFNGTFPALASSTSGMAGLTSSSTVGTRTTSSQSGSAAASIGSGGSGTQASASARSSPDAAAGLSAGKAAVLLGAVGGLVALGV